MLCYATPPVCDAMLRYAAWSQRHAAETPTEIDGPAAVIGRPSRSTGLGSRVPSIA